MSVKSVGAKILAYFVQQKIARWASQPLATQERVFKNLIKQAQNTAFGKAHQFEKIRNFADFAQRVPIRDYEDFTPYIHRIRQGETDVLWRGRPLYFAKTSGTTSGAKYIPITKESMPYHVQAARDAILCYIHHTGKSHFVDGKMIFLQGSPILHEENGIKIGRLSGISAHYVPAYLQANRLPSWQTNCIEDWETKVNEIVKETAHQNMTVISGIPSWVQMYFEKLVEFSGKSVGELFPNFQLFIYGGVNYAPYRQRFEQLIGRPVDSIELFPASEGFFAYQDHPAQNGMLLLLNSGIFYEFVPVEEIGQPHPTRLTIDQVELGKNYALIISTNAGLWAYNIGDTVQFVSKKPYRIIVSGRVKHFISAFGEHVIASEVEQSLQEALMQIPAQVNEFTVAPEVNPAEGLPYHQWLIEFETPPQNLPALEQAIDQALQKRNSYYYDLIQGKVLRPLKITPVAKGGFAQYMKTLGKLGGQNKVQRLSNDRRIADALATLQ